MHNKNMEEPFDPYLRWLAIRDPRRPPNHYRLLGIDLFETDIEVIQNAADRQMTHIRRFQGGKHAAESQQVLNELAAAKVCLLDAGKKAAYDAALRAGAPPAPRVVTPPPLPRGRDFSTAAPQVSSVSAEEVSIPSLPLPLAKLQERQTGNYAPAAEPKSSRPFPSETKFNVFSISFYLSVAVAVSAILIGIFVLWSNARKKTEAPPPANSIQEDEKPNIAPTPPTITPKSAEDKTNHKNQRQENVRQENEGKEKID
jgi:hypothetical protein